MDLGYGGVGGVQVFLDEPGAIGVEIGVELSGGLTLLDAEFVDMDAFDTPNPGDNPFIDGSPEGGDAVGLSYNTDENWIFASFGGPGAAAGTYDLLRFTYSPPYTSTGLGEVSGYVAQSGDLGPLLSDSAALGIPILGDCNLDGFVSTLDIDPFVQTLTDPAGWEADHFDLPVKYVADLNGDQKVNTLDIDSFIMYVTGVSPAAGAAPEPSGGLLAASALTTMLLGARRRRVLMAF